ncbi:heme exporter protein CcmD [Qingshengfaniella alkalisoli]|uniref:Heme exporter protein D n=1 Tax=Qingshengfaniella alkalisoli TaxID=2599296 RepID=A0A5B8I6A3_9RHOB|nr:heme exporter protein CcmD [Qingshengfaniella alkalisoli]QDY68995.1 heme exporter protein CcmD [Qingshengfaniella alkalisoli]
MLPELGKYAGTVLAAYGTSAVLLIGLVLLSLRRSRVVRRQLERIERERH